MTCSWPMWSIMQASWSRMIVHAQHIDCITLNYIIVFSWISWTILSLLVDLWFTKCWTPNVETNSRLNVTHTLLPCSYNVVTVLFFVFFVIFGTLIKAADYLPWLLTCTVAQLKHTAACVSPANKKTILYMRLLEPQELSTCPNADYTFGWQHNIY